MPSAPMPDLPKRPPEVGIDAPPPDLGDALRLLRPAVRALLGHVLRVAPGHPDVDDCESEVYRRTVEGRSRIDPSMPLKPTPSRRNLVPVASCSSSPRAAAKMRCASCVGVSSVRARVRILKSAVFS